MNLDTLSFFNQERFKDIYKFKKPNNAYFINFVRYDACLLYTSDAADERSSVDLGGRRIIKKKNNINHMLLTYIIHKK